MQIDVENAQQRRHFARIGHHDASKQHGYIQMPSTENHFDPRAWEAKPLAFLDFEASGLHPDSYPLKVSICTLDDEDTYETLIKPATYWNHWSFDAQDLHGIERDSLIREGRSPESVAADLNRLFAGKTLIADANEDAFWMDVLFEAAGIDQKFDVVNVYNLLDGGRKTIFHKSMPKSKAHRPMEDAISVRNAWFACLTGNI